MSKNVREQRKNFDKQLNPSKANVKYASVKVAKTADDTAANDKSDWDY